MKKNDIIRAWKDSDFRNQLEGDVPANPAGDLSTDDLRKVSGGAARPTHRVLTLGCCPAKPSTKATLCCPKRG